MPNEQKDTADRPDWDSYFIDIMDAVAKRATCDRGRSGCLIVKDKRILVTGYVGSPSGVSHCDDIGHEISEVLNDDGTTSKHCIRTTHAEQNALVQAARFGIPVDGSTLYVGMEPCYTCAKMIINAGIMKVICSKKYHRAQRTRDVFKQAGIELVVLSNTEESYSNKV